MITDILLLIIAAIAVLFATIVDIKTTEIPNWITYNLIIIALAIRLIAAITTNQFDYIINALIILIIVTIIAQGLYRLQIWGGGDSKLLMALSAVFATKPYFLNFNYPFFLILVANILLAGAIYSLVFAIVLAVKHRRKFILETKKLYKKIRLTRLITLLISIVFFISVIFTPLIAKMIIILTAIIILIYPYLWIMIKATENAALFKKIHVNKLLEGDWIINDIIKDKKTIYKRQKIGITKKQIEELKKHKIETVTIKAGIQFAPAFILGLALTIIIGVI